MNSKVDLAKLFCIVEITEQVEAIFNAVKTKAHVASAFINGPEPEPRILPNCPNKLSCPFVQRHFSDLPDYSVLDIAPK